jgi:hypothetical protein
MSSKLLLNPLGDFAIDDTWHNLGRSQCGGVHITCIKGEPCAIIFKGVMATGLIFFGKFFVLQLLLNPLREFDDTNHNMELCILQKESYPII